MKSGDIFGSQDYFTGLAVMADTYSNHNSLHKVSIASVCIFFFSIFIRITVHTYKFPSMYCIHGKEFCAILDRR